MAKCKGCGEPIIEDEDDDLDAAIEAVDGPLPPALCEDCRDDFDELDLEDQLERSFEMGDDEDDLEKGIAEMAAARALGVIQ